MKMWLKKYLNANLLPMKFAKKKIFITLSVVDSPRKLRLKWGASINWFNFLKRWDLINHYYFGIRVLVAVLLKIFKLLIFLP